MTQPSLFKPGINVVIPNYNGAQLLEDNIPTILKALDASNLSYRIIVVDDCSTDESVLFLKQNYPDILVVQNVVNEGFSKTCNNGISCCDFHLTCIVNSDVSFEQSYFINAVSLFDDPDLFAIKGDIQNYEHSKNNVFNIDKTSMIYFSRGFLRFKHQVEPDRNSLTGRVNEQLISLGCCFLASTEKLKDLQGYDERYSPFYWEDADLAIRAFRRGYRLKYVPECLVFHKSSSTISITQSDNKRRVVSIRNKFMFTWRHLPSRQYWLKHIVFVILSLATRWVILDWRYYYCFGLALYQTYLFRKR